MSQMQLIRRYHWLYTWMFIEGFVILATEILAIRQLTPFVGNSIEVVSVVIAAVLIPMSFGYFQGSKINFDDSSKGKAIRRKLTFNFLLTAAILCLGLSYQVMTLFFMFISKIGVRGLLIQTALYVACFIFFAVYLLAQTLPILGHYLRRVSPSLASGTSLFFSTLGSFLGSVLLSLVVMMIWGVNYAVMVVIVLLVAMAFSLNRWRLDERMVVGLVIIATTVFLNRDETLRNLEVVAMTPYSTIAVHDDQIGRMLSINHSASARIAVDPKDRFAYVRFIENNWLKNTPGLPPKKVLVIGGGGATIGEQDRHNQYTFVDVDRKLKSVIENHFFDKPLPNNKTMIAAPARGFLRENHERYDLIILDAYSHIKSVPNQLITREFFQEVRKHLAPDGWVVFNAICHPTFGDVFSKRLHRTFTTVFPQSSRQVVSKNAGWAWSSQGDLARNVIYSAKADQNRDMSVYIDRWAPVDYDRARQKATAV